MEPALKLEPERSTYETKDRSTAAGVSKQRAKGNRPTSPFPKATPFIVSSVIGLLLLGLGLLLVSQRVQLMAMTYELEALQQQLVRLEQEHARLLVVQASAASLERLETTARTRLGMVSPSSVTTVVVVEEDKRMALAAEEKAPSLLATIGSWLQQRLMTMVEAGERQK